MEGFAFKGFSYDEILAKIGKIHRVGDMVINFETLRLTKAGMTVKLTKNEWKYLAVLMSCSGEPVSRETLYRMVVGLDGGTTRSIDTFIAMLRHHFGGHIETVHAVGYRWVVTPTVRKTDARYHDQTKPSETKAVKPVKLKPITRPVKPGKPVKNTPPPLESSERIYRIRGMFVQWNGRGEIPEPIAAYQQVHGEMPSFITLPIGKIWFTISNDLVVVYRGKGALPSEVLDYLEENKYLPPWVQHRVNKIERSKRAA
jgi:DNA-binding winged helix-turn-helix (wHTH) protein